jgi:peptidoglycan/xylan/chitin deacetylase (PgdA/CDA1 family)
VTSLRRREYSLPDREPIVSFTFDDFPRSALETGGKILKSHGGCGTYYAAMGLMGGAGKLGEYFSFEDLKSLLADGHELGSHTFSHLSCRTTPFPTFQSDAQKGRDAIINFTGTPELHQFAYPYGHMTLRAKGQIGSQMNSCRSTLKGINTSPVDLHMLRANNLYNGTIDLLAIEQLLRANDRRRGWLVFYTHDVRDNPSPWGCKPSQLEAVVRLATRMRARFLTVGRVIAQLEDAAGGTRERRVLSPTRFSRSE